MRKRLVMAAVFLVAVIQGWSEPTFPQASNAQAQLNGTVTDPSGGTIAKATITLRNTDTNVASTAVSNGQGYYVLLNLPPGPYELTVESSGFATFTQNGIVLTVGQAATLNVTMKVAAASEKVVVSAQAPVIEPTRTAISQVVSTEQIQDLPISNRLFTDFALLSPGVSTGRISLQSTFTDPSTTRITFGGQRDLDNRSHGGRSGRHQHSDGLAEGDAVAGSGERISRGEQQLRSAIRAIARRNREHRDEIGHQRSSWLGL